MDTEEKNAVEFVKKRTKELKKYAKRENELVYDDIILNLINKLQEENEKLKNTDLKQAKIEYLEVLNEKLQKENEELNYKLHSKKIALEIYNRYIPKSKVKEKIEELDKEEKRELKGTKGQDRYYIKQKYMYKRKVLQELLEESEE